jgi:hypothetical protein
MPVRLRRLAAEGVGTAVDHLITEPSSRPRANARGFRR